MTVLFTIGEKYSRKIIQELLQVPSERRGGIWNNGSCQYNGEYFIFANINTPGTTGHDYKNQFIGDDLEWYGETSSKLHWPSIQNLITTTTTIHILYRENNRDEFIYLGLAKCKKYFDTSPVKIVWSFDKESNAAFITPAEEISNPQVFFEGAQKQITVNVYERNPQARRRCIEHHGSNCKACNFDFYKKYGELGKEFIHVHHIIPLSEVRQGYELDPIKDLIPLCANCHAITHRRKPALSLSELKELIHSNEMFDLSLQSPISS